MSANTKRTTPKTNNRNISEVKYGYLVAYKTNAGPTTKHFAFTKHGGKRAALAAARKFRDKLIGTPHRAATKAVKRALKSSSRVAPTRRATQK